MITISKKLAIVAVVGYTSWICLLAWYAFITNYKLKVSMAISKGLMSILKALNPLFSSMLFTDEHVEKIVQDVTSEFFKQENDI